jgi:hypothetical protein
VSCELEGKERMESKDLVVAKEDRYSFTHKYNNIDVHTVLIYLRKNWKERELVEEAKAVFCCIAWSLLSFILLLSSSCCCVSLVAPSSQSAVSGGNTAKTSHHRMMHDRIYIHHVLDTTSTTRAEGISQELA